MIKISYDVLIILNDFKKDILAMDLSMVQMAGISLSFALYID